MMRIAAAQTISKPGDVLENASRHLDVCRAAAQRGVEFLVFPELSLSGYEPTLALRCKVDPYDERLNLLRAMAAQASMTIAVGAPVACEDGGGLSIGCITLFPNRLTAVYRKRFLHPGEEHFAAAGTVMTQCHRVARTSVALAICADTTHEEHAAAAKLAQADVYAASAFWTPGGYATDAAMMGHYATVHGFAVLMANHGGPTGSLPSAGRSAVWAPGGESLGSAPERGQALMIATQVGGRWSAEAVSLGTLD